MARARRPIAPLSYTLGREAAADSLAAGDWPVGQIPWLIAQCRYYARQTDRPREHRAYWLGVARRIRESC